MGFDFDWEVHAPRPRAQVEWWMGYPYYYLWTQKRSRRWWGQDYTYRPISPAFPTAPTLFLYGAKKRTMFHSQAFEARVNATVGSRVIRYEGCRHWLMHEEPARFARDVRAFLLE